MKKLIVSGDSCTDLAFRSICHPTWDFSWPKWPELLAKHLGMELVCVAKSGAGNQYIHDTILDEIVKTPKEEIGLVIAAWSQSFRKDWQTGWLGTWHSKRTDQDGDLLGWVTKSLRTYLSFQMMCENYNLPYYHFQMGDLFESYLEGLKPTESDRLLHNMTNEDRMKYPGDKLKDEEKLLEIIGKYNKHINNFIGWPGLQEKYDRLGGFNMISHVLGRDRIQMEERGLIVSDQDDHPNEKGHQAITNLLIGEINVKNI